MSIIESTPTEFKLIVQNPFSVFDSMDFSNLNSAKVDEVKYLIFHDGKKNRFGLVCGIIDGIMKAPFSAPYACFSRISGDSKILNYSDAVKELVEYARNKGLKKIRITLPPNVYDESHIARVFNSLYVSGFRIAGCDLNYHYNLDNFNLQYEMSIDPKARQKLRAAIKHDLKFQKTEDVKTVYEIIHQNRTAKGYPLWMSYQNVLDTIKVVKTDFFLIFSNKEAIASSIVYHCAPERAQVIYWGNKEGTDDLRAMNFLAYKSFEYYKERAFKFFDIGPSTEYSRPNFGLCDFKQSIGCDVSTKLTFELDL